MLFASCAYAAPKQDVALVPSKRPITIFLAGDVLLGRGVTPILPAGRSNLQLYQKHIQGADIAFCNLECALKEKPTTSSLAVRLLAPPSAFGYLQQAGGASSRTARLAVRLLAPPSAFGYLQQAGFDVVSTANNHALDNGVLGLRLLEKAARLARIDTVGLSPTPVSQWPVTTRLVQGQKISWLAATNWGPFQSGSARVRPVANSNLIQQVRLLARQGHKVLVSLHWGLEYAVQPTEGQKRLAHALIDAGATSVVGHHSHVAGPVEMYRGRPIFYSLGNFVFDRTPRPQSGLTAMLTLDGEKIKVQTRMVHLPHSASPGNLVPPLPLPLGERVHVELQGRFLAETGPQRLRWTQTPSGLHRLLLFRYGTNGWRLVARGTHPIIEELRSADLDGDGRDEIWLQLRQRSKLDVAVRSRLHLYRADAKRGFLPVWRGSALSRPFHEWGLLPRVGKGTHLVALETNNTFGLHDFSWISVYRWNGFGFRRLWDAPLQGKLRDLKVGSDAQSPFLTVRQALKGKVRILELRPTKTTSTGLFQAVIKQNWQQITGNE